MDHYLSTDLWQQTVDEHSIRLGEPSEDNVRIIALSQLHEEAACREYLSWLQEYIGAPDMRVAASMLAKRIGYLWIAPLLIAMTVHHQHVSFRLDNSFLYHPTLTANEGGDAFSFSSYERASGRSTNWRQGSVAGKGGKGDVCVTPCTAVKDACCDCSSFDEYPLGEYHDTYCPIIYS
ncbi:hypothetical protein ACWA2B_25465 [Paenibacillus sp. CMM36]